jgi:hypothetical protein
MGALIVSLSSCKDDDDDPIQSSRGTISGVVTDDEGAPISDVTVTVSGIQEEDMSVTTGADGSYTVENVTVKTHAVTVLLTVSHPFFENVTAWVFTVTFSTV